MTTALTVPEQMMHATARIECTGVGGVKSWGTGFFYNFLDDGTTHVPVIVTNKHVIRGAHTGAFWLTKKSDNNLPIVGSHHKVELGPFEPLWIPHPDADVDLAILPVASFLNQALSQGHKYFYVPFNKSLIPTKDNVESFSGFDDIVMVGYPNALWDSTNNLPILRSGVTATHPKYDYEGKPQFLIDCACFPGSSGSPVLIYDKNGWKDRSGNIFMGQERVLLVGVLFAGPQHIAEGDIARIEVPDLAERTLALSRIPNNLGFVVKSKKLNDFEQILRDRQRAA
jgi:hypothetical protein